MRWFLSNEKSFVVPAWRAESISLYTYHKVRIPKYQWDPFSSEGHCHRQACPSCSLQWGWDYVSELQSPTGLLFMPQMIHEYGEPWWSDIDGGTEELGEKLVPMPLCPPQIQYGLTWTWTQTSMVRGWPLTTWAMVRPMHALTKTWKIRELKWTF
jgi:hypothetical protein